MAKPEYLNKPIFLAQPKASKSYALSLSKTLFIVLLLVILPLFPSQAPEFINQTIITKLWELIHLLVIGIAVSYGLFGRKNAETGDEIPSKLDNSQEFLSGILPFPSIFEDGYENPHGSDDKKQIQTWNSQYFHSESTVFVSRENCVLDELGKPRSVFDHKPLGLPVRSLRSRIQDHDSVKGNESGSGSKGGCKNSDKIRKGKFRGLAPINLEEKFKETVAFPSPVPWGSRSSRIEVRERNLSVGELKFDYLKSESFWSPIFSQTSSVLSPPKEETPPSIISQEIPDSKMENSGSEKGSSCWSSSKLRNGFSFGSLSEMNVQGKCDGKLKDFSRSIREEPLGRENFGLDFWKTEGKPLSRGKSVRTIRPKVNVLEGRKVGERCSDHVDEEGKTNFDKSDDFSLKGRSKITNCDKFDDFSLKESSKLSKQMNVEIHDFGDSNGCENGKDSESEFEKFQVSSGEEEEEAKFDVANDEELDAFEVDKKAGEFIAKFREQIRLQKIASGKGFS